MWDRIVSTSPWPGPQVITTSAPVRLWPANAPLSVSVLAVALSTVPPIWPRTECWIAVVCAFSAAMSCWARTYTVRGVAQFAGVKMISTADSQVDTVERDLDVALAVVELIGRELGGEHGDAHVGGRRAGQRDGVGVDAAGLVHDGVAAGLGDHDRRLVVVGHLGGDPVDRAAVPRPEAWTRPSA